MNFLYLLFTFITFGSLLFDAILYPTFTLQHFHIDSVMILLCYAIFTVILRHDISIAHKKLHNIHKKIIYPILIVSSTILLMYEHLNYNNFVFSYLHLHPFLFLYLPIFSGIVIFAPRLNLNHRFKYFLYTALFFLLGIYLSSLYFPQFFSRVIKEDGVLEYLQFFFYLVASICAFGISHRLRQKKGSSNLPYIFLLLGFGLFFIAGEEISWGQRFLGISTPESLSEINVQDEITVHNLYFFQNVLPWIYLIVGIYGTFSRVLAERLFKNNKNIHLLTPPYFLVPIFFVVSLFYYQNMFGLYTYTQVTSISDIIFPQKWNEVIEVCLAFSFFGYTYYTFQTTKKAQTRTI